MELISFYTPWKYPEVFWCFHGDRKRPVAWKWLIWRGKRKEDRIKKYNMQTMIFFLTLFKSTSFFLKKTLHNFVQLLLEKWTYVNGVSIRFNNLVLGKFNFLVFCLLSQTTKCWQYKKAHRDSAWYQSAKIRKVLLPAY